MCDPTRCTQSCCKRANPEPQSAAIQIDRRALRSALRDHAPLLEALAVGAVPKAVGRPGANVAALWRMTMAAMYTSADVPVLAVRESCQNSADALKAAIRARQIKDGEGFFKVSWDGEERTLVLEDNGVGMSADDIITKFLVLGASGKTGAIDSDEAAGGFGVAKAVILGTASKFRWKMHTRDNLAVSKDANGDVEIFQADARKGTQITLFDVSDEYDTWWDSGSGGSTHIEDRFLEVLAANDLPGIRLYYNGEVVAPLFSRRGGSVINVVGSWGTGTTARVKAYRRDDRRGAFWVRLNGLYQFKQPTGGDLGVDVVLDLTTTVRPGEKGYPLNAGRDAFQGEARNTFRAVVEEVERENLSAGDKEDDEVYDAEGETDAGLLEDAEELTRTLLEEPSLAKVLEQAGVTPPAPEPDSAPTSIPTSTRPVLKTDAPDDYVLDLTPSKGRLPWFPAGLQTPTAIQTALTRAENESPYEMSQGVLDALDAARTGKLTVAQLRVIAEEMDQAARIRAQYVNGTQTRVDVTERKERRGSTNPFGSLGALRISRVNYDKDKARTFKRSPRKWLPLLLLWEATLKLMARAGSINRPFKPGFVLEDGTLGLAQHRPGSLLTVIYIHPDRLLESIQQHRHQPIAIAGFLHGVSAHELAHMDGRMGEGHSQAFISAREDLGRRTAYILPQLATLAVKLLKLPEPKDETAARLLQLERQLAQARTSRDTVRADRAEKAKAIKALERELAACQAEVQARAMGASAQARAACTGACPPESSLPVPGEIVVTPGSEVEPPPSQNAIQLVRSMRALLLEAPPQGLDVGYIERFFQRYHEHLARIVEARMPVRMLEEV